MSSSSKVILEYTYFAIFFFTYLLIIVPFMIYQIVTFWKFRSKPLIKKRRPVLALIYIITLLIVSCIIRPCLLIISIYLSNIALITLAIRICSLYVCVLLFSFRAWIIIYDFNYNLAIFKKRCLSAILSPSYNYSNFWLKNKSIFGSPSLLLPYIIGILIVLGICAFILGMLNILWMQIFAFSNFTLLVLLFLFISQFITSHRDKFYIKKEIVLTTCVWFILIVIYAVILYFPKTEWLYLNDHIKDLIIYITEIICTTILILLSTWNINIKCNKSDVVGSDHFKKLKVISKSVNIYSDGAGGGQFLSMNRTLAHNEGYGLFMEYLLEEISIENLLFITEIVHLKHTFHKLQYKRKKLNTKINKKLSKKKSTKLNVIKYRRKSSNNSLSGHTDDENDDNDASDIKDDIDISDIDVSDNEMDDDISRSVTMDNDDQSTAAAVTMPTSTPRHHEYNLSKIDWKQYKNKYAFQSRDDVLPCLPKSIYKSSIMKENNFNLKIRMIFEKYIIVGALYEINIKFNYRKKLLLHYHNKYKNYSITNDQSNYKKDVYFVEINNNIYNDDIKIFDESTRSIMSLLRNSYIQFCQTKEYKAFENAYRSDEKIDLFTALKGGNEKINCCSGWRK